MLNLLTKKKLEECLKKYHDYKLLHLFVLDNSHSQQMWKFIGCFSECGKTLRQVIECVRWQSPTEHPNERTHADFSSYLRSWFLIKVLNLEGRYVSIFKVIDIPSVAQPPPSQPPDITLNASISTISGPHTFPYFTSHFNIS